MSSVLATELLYGLLRTLGLSLLRNRGLAAKDILLDLARGWANKWGQISILDIRGSFRSGSHSNAVDS